ncbi:uncharacterized protein B0H18DRAFT_874930, partial [Fomitopsis serialis]|uniref:uncharacterized protein n=1 Tax=Fomitopsis serialis TaxID=139415 RepID=UPI00200731F2
VSKVLEEWKPKFPSILEDILAAEVPANIGGPCICGNALATVRCRDCLQGALQCRQCLVDSHRLSPLHWIDVWNGRCLERQDMSEAGLVLYLGHNGHRCPSLRGTKHPIVYTVTHSNGIHRVPVHECCCPDARGTVSQLLRAGLFPATLERPESAFTFDVLRQWDMHFLTSKKGTYDYYDALRRLTDNSGTRIVKNRYRELNLAGRLWQHLTALKRSGMHHDLILPNRPASIAVPCFACPWPGFNMPPNWQQTPPDLAYIHGCELGGDGNHGLQKKRKRDDPADVSLGEGRGFFVDPMKMQTYLAEIDAEAAVSTPHYQPETCSGFKVGRAQRPGKFRNLEVSGVVAVICIRHGCFRPGAMVDLQKGERYVNACQSIQFANITSDMVIWTSLWRAPSQGWKRSCISSSPTTSRASMASTFVTASGSASHISFRCSTECSCFFRSSTCSPTRSAARYCTRFATLGGLGSRTGRAWSTRGRNTTKSASAPAR